MKTIAVLIDYTPGSKKALEQGVSFAKKNDAQLFAVHIVSSSDKVSAAENELNTFISESNSQGVNIKPIVQVGSLTIAANAAAMKVDADLMIICTHGIKGMFQQLFGAQILKLVQAVTCQCLVVSEQTNTDLSTADKILFPVGPHPEFNIKIKQTAEIAKSLSASVTIYWIDKPGSDFDNHMAKNIEAAKIYFDQEKIQYTTVVEEAVLLSVGYSRQTIDFAAKNGYHLLSMMASVSKNDILFGFGDKENFLVNNQGIAVLSCNA